MWSWLGSVIGIALAGYFSSRYFEPRDMTLIMWIFHDTINAKSDDLVIKIRS